MFDSHQADNRVFSKYDLEKVSRPDQTAPPERCGGRVRSLGPGLPGRRLTHICRGALLHDIGKIGVPDRILNKPGQLTEDEWELVRQHSVYAYEMLRPIQFLRSTLDIPYFHHEKWGGTGYPRGLKGEQIPLAARIFAMVDVWDALRSDRSYRKAWQADRVRAHIRVLSGTHFDPQMVEVFLKLVDGDIKDNLSNKLSKE